MSATLQLDAKDNVTEKLFKLEQQNLRLIEQNKQLAAASRRAHKESSEGLGRVSGLLQAQAGELKTLVLGLVGGGGVVGAVHTAISAYNDWQSTIRNLGREHQTFTNQFVSDLAKSRDAALAPEIETWAKTVPGVTEVQAQRILAGVTSEMQTGPLVRRQAISEAVAAAAPIKPLPGELEQTAKVAGQFGRMFPDYAPHEIAGLAVGLQQLPEVDVSYLTGDAIQRLVTTFAQAGMPGEEALAQALVAVQKGQRRLGVLQAAAEAIDKQMEPVKPSRGHRVLTPEERAKNRFAEAGPAERLQLLKADREVRDAMLGGQSLMFAQIGDAEVRAMLGDMRRMRRPGFVSEQAAAIAAGPSGAKVAEAQRQQFATYSAEEADRLLGERLHRADQRFKEYQAGRNFLSRAMGEVDWWWAKLINPENPERQMFGYPGKGPITSETSREKIFLRRAEQEEASIRAVEAAARGRRSAEPAGGGSVRGEPSLEEVARLLREIERNTCDTKYETRRVEGNTRPRTSPAAVQGNIKQHGE